MADNIKFHEWAIANGFDVSYNTGSKYFNSKATRIAYFQWQIIQENT